MVFVTLKKVVRSTFLSGGTENKMATQWGRGLGHENIQWLPWNGEARHGTPKAKCSPLFVCIAAVGVWYKARDCR